LEREAVLSAIASLLEEAGRAWWGVIEQGDQIEECACHASSLDTMNLEEALAIGARARMIRRRRGLSLEVVAGLAGISKQYLSALERGQRGFNRRGLIEDLAHALGCSVADLTGQPYLAPDRATVEGRAALPGISLALNDYGPDEVPRSDAATPR
jgi:transcriptional regulator with XRE-family HTH domain